MLPDRRDEPQESEVAGLLVAEVGRQAAGGGDQVRNGVDRHLHDVVDRVELCQRLRQPQQCGGGLGRLALGLEQLRVLERHRGVRCQDLEESLILLVELRVPEHGQRDDTQQLVADGHRHGEHRFQHVVRAGDLDGERHLARVRRDERLAGLRDRASDAFADLRDQRLDGVLLVVREHLAAERDRIQRVAVGLQEVDPAAVVGDDRAQLGGDGRADLDRIVQRIELGGETVQHVELRHGTEAIGGGARLVLLHLRSYLVTRRHHVGSSHDRSSALPCISARSPQVLEPSATVVSLAP